MGQAVAMPVKELTWNGNSVLRERSLHIKANRFAVAQDANESDGTRLGLIRVLGCWGDRKEHIPGSKSHELWVPLPDSGSKALPISPEALERFYALADERTDREQTLPFQP